MESLKQHLRKYLPEVMADRFIQSFEILNCSDYDKARELLGVSMTNEQIENYRKDLCIMLSGIEQKSEDEIKSLAAEMAKGYKLGFVTGAVVTIEKFEADKKAKKYVA